MTILEAIIAVLAKSKRRDGLNLRWHYQSIMNYRGRYKTPPRRGGSRLVLDPWVRGLVEHTFQNRDRYFSAVFAANDDHYRSLLCLDVKDLWQTLDSITARDTHYYGIAKDKKRGMWSGKHAWLCTPIYPDGTVNVLYGDGSVKELRIDPKDRAAWTPAALGLTK